MPHNSDPFLETTRLLVDGSNLLHALSSGADQLPSAAVIGRIRALVPAGVAVTIVLDGPPAPGAHERRVTSGIEVRHANRRSADDVLRELVAHGSEGTLVVTDDRALGHDLRMSGARLAGTKWLAERLGRQRLEAPSIARSRPPSIAGSTAPAGARSGTRNAGANAANGANPADGGDEARRWQPGRGATKKRGNPHRGRPAE
jgi:hypothetical protein